MHIFKCKSRLGKLAPVDSSKGALWFKLLDHLERTDEIVTVTIEVKSKVINQNQEGLYKAFIVKAADHFGTDFQDMQTTLKPFFPMDYEGFKPLHRAKDVSRWTSEELDTFINKASAHLADFGFHFK